MAPLNKLRSSLHCLTTSLTGLAATGLKFATWQSTYPQIKILLNEPDSAERDRLTRLWRDSKISELEMVGLTVSANIVRPYNSAINTASIMS